MYKFIIATFLVLGWAFYEFSGGSDFEPEQVAFDKPLVQEATPIVEPVEKTVTLAIAPAIEAPAPIEEVVVASATLDITPEADPVVSDAGVATLTSLSEAAEIAAALEAEPEATVATLTFEPTQVTASPVGADVRSVAGSRVNMRSGPGTDYGVLATLPRGTEAEVLEVDTTGWARIRIIGSGQIGWMAERLLETS